MRKWQEDKPVKTNINEVNGEIITFPWEGQD